MTKEEHRAWVGAFNELKKIQDDENLYLFLLRTGRPPPSRNGKLFEPGSESRERVDKLLTRHFGGMPGPMPHEKVELKV